jgi:hypothetical protein
MAYFIVLNNPDPGFDPFVNGKAMAHDANRLSKVASSLGLKTPDDYFSMSADDVASAAEEFDLGEEIQAPPETWFDADEGLAWVAQLQAHIQANPKAVKDANALLADLQEYQRVFSQAKSIGAKWHLSVDF